MNSFHELLRCNRFEWDEHNTEKIWVKHHVSPTECEQLVFNVPLIVGEDIKHSKQEERYYVLGNTDAERLLFIVFPIRQDRSRVISARDMNRKERKVYLFHEKENTKLQE